MSRRSRFMRNLLNPDALTASPCSLPEIDPDNFFYSILTALEKLFILTVLFNSHFFYNKIFHVNITFFSHVTGKG